eukprot:COSAG06_NODE_2133_length_7518_cov_11.249495_7_plen_81_part_00
MRRFSRVLARRPCSVAACCLTVPAAAALPGKASSVLGGAAVVRWYCSWVSALIVSELPLVVTSNAGRPPLRHDHATDCAV